MATKEEERIPHRDERVHEVPARRNLRREALDDLPNGLVQRVVWSWTDKMWKLSGMGNRRALVGKSIISGPSTKYTGRSLYIKGMTDLDNSTSRDLAME